MEVVGSVAQRLEQGTHNPLVLGSNPSGPTVFGGRWNGAGGRKRFTGYGPGDEKRRVFLRGGENWKEHDAAMRPLMLLFALVVVGWADEENSAQRLENAQKGMAEASWPRKPDERLSPLSGKMKPVSEISPKFYGEEKEFRTRSWGDAQKAAIPSPSTTWQGPRDRKLEEAGWDQAGEEWSEEKSRNKKYQPSVDSGSNRILAYRELSRQEAPEWSSRSSYSASEKNGFLRMYEGRLTRVRERVAREEASPRDLGPGRKEKFSPEEVEKMLSEPSGPFRGMVRE